MRRLALAFLFIIVCASQAFAYDCRVYLMRGLLGGAFNYSRGMDTMALNEVPQLGCKGYVKPHWRSNEFVATAIANYKIDRLPVIVGGHSVGADAVSDVAEKLRRAGVPVSLALYFDPTRLVQPVPGNVSRAVEFRGTLLFNLGKGFITLSPGFKGTAQIYSGGIAHVALDDDFGVHRTSLCEIRNVISKSPINLCPLSNWTATLPSIFGLIPTVPRARSASARMTQPPIYSHGDQPSGQ